MTERERARVCAPLLKPWHIRTLRHVKDTFGIFGWESYRNTEAELVELRLIRGEWIGSLDMEPRPHWTVTELGRMALEEITALETAKESR